MDKKSKLWYLQRFNLFKKLAAAERKRMGQRAAMRTYKAGEYIYFPDDAINSIYLLKGGRIKIGSYSSEGEEILKAILYPGELFGALSFNGKEHHAEFSQVLDEPATLCILSTTDLQDIINRNPSLGIRVTQLIGLRLRRMERRLEALLQKDARTRIIEFICDMAEERGKPVGVEILVEMKLTHQLIAKLTGTSRQTVTTVLNDLRTKNDIYFDRKRMLIRDLDKLKKKAEAIIPARTS